jgi:hypothetical protein
MEKYRKESARDNFDSTISHKCAKRSWKNNQKGYEVGEVTLNDEWVLFCNIQNRSQ